jgi:hypothetical protein
MMFSPYIEDAPKYQLPALPILLELVLRKVKGCGSHNTLGFGRL